MPISTRSYCYLLLWFGFIALAAHLTPYFANDYRYMLVQGTNDLVSSWFDILLSQYRHYFEWGGRTVAHLIAQSLLYVGNPGSAVIQALCYITLILFIYFNAYGIRPQLKLRFHPIFVITLMLFLQLRVYGEVVFNVVSSANYLYTTTLVLIFLLPYRISMRSEISLHPIVLWPMMAILGLIAGWTNENTAAAVAAILGLYLLYCLLRKELKFWQCIGYAFFLLGFALLVFSPGNEARLDSMTERGFDYSEHTFDALYIFAVSLLACGLLVLSLAFVLYRVHASMLHLANRPIYMGGMFFLAIGFLSLFLMIFSPNFPARATTPFTICSIIALIAFSDLLVRRYGTVVPQNLFKILLFGGFAIMIALVVDITLALNRLQDSMTQRAREIVAAQDAHVQNMVVSPLEVATYKYIYVADVRARPSYWTNNIMRQFYQVETIVCTCDFPDETFEHDFVFFARYNDLSQCKPVEFDMAKELAKLNEMPSFSNVPRERWAPAFDIFGLHFDTAKRD